MCAKDSGGLNDSPIAIAKKYPHKEPGAILSDLVASTPGDEGKWFAAAKEAGLYREAIDLAQRSPCDPRTLIRAARDMATKEPSFAVEAGRVRARNEGTHPPLSSSGYKPGNPPDSHSLEAGARDEREQEKKNPGRLRQAQAAGNADIASESS